MVEIRLSKRGKFRFKLCEILGWKLILVKKWKCRFKLRGLRRGGGADSERSRQVRKVLLYCSVCRAIWRQTSTRKRSISRSSWHRRSRPATPAVSRWSPAGRTLFPAPRRRGPAAPAPSRTCTGSGRSTRRPDWWRCRRKANAEIRRPRRRTAGQWHTTLTKTPSRLR